MLSTGGGRTLHPVGEPSVGKPLDGEGPPGAVDPVFHQLQTVLFMKNVAMSSAALLIGSFGAGPVSLDARRAKRE